MDNYDKLPHYKPHRTAVQNYSTLPPALTGRAQFVLWKLSDDTNARGRHKKPPVNSSGHTINALDPSNWLSFEQALSALKGGARADGIGFVLTESCGLSVLDIDNASRLNGAALEAVSALNSWAETSISGDGLHIFMSGNIPPAVNTPDIQLYQQRQFIALTGAQVAGTPGDVRNCENEFSDVWAELLAAAPASPADTETPTPTATPLKTPARPVYSGGNQILERAFNAKNGAETKRIFDGGTHGGKDQTESGVLFSILTRLAPYCANTSELCDVAKQSAHYSERWEKPAGGGQTLLNRSADNAFSKRKADLSRVSDSKKHATESSKKAEIEFWFETKGEKLELKINRLNFVRFLESKGYVRVWIEESISVVVKIVDNIAEEQTPEQIRDAVTAYVRSLPFDITSNFTRENLETVLISGYNVYFSEPNIKHVSECRKPFHKDTPTALYIYFRNGFTETTRNGTKLKPYSELNGIIWRSQILERDYVKVSDEKINAGAFAKFQRNICAPPELRHTAPTVEQTAQIDRRLMSLRSSMGYIMHRYATPVNIKCVVFCDEKITLDLERGGHGGSGKGLSLEGIRRVRNIQNIDGKTFDFKDKFRYQDVTMQTDVVFFDDINKKFDIENLYSVLSNGYIVEPKGKDRIKLPQPIKTVITTNYVLTGDTPSDIRRKFEVEVSSYYSDTYTPVHDFGCDLFGEEWDANEWAAFDGWMLGNARIYLTLGLIESEHVNLKLRRLIASTKSEFVEFAAEIPINEEIDKKELFEKFIEEYPDFRNSLRQRTFTNWLKAYAKFKGFIELAKENGTERRSNGNDYFTFKASENSRVVTVEKRLPARAAKDDSKWILEQLESVPADMKQYAIEQYDAVWMSAYTAETEEGRKENAGRAAANYDLRAWVEQCNPA